MIIPAKHIEKGFATHQEYSEYLNGIGIKVEPPLHDIKLVADYFETTTLLIGTLLKGSDWCSPFSQSCASVLFWPPAAYAPEKGMPGISLYQCCCGGQDRDAGWGISFLPFYRNPLFAIHAGYNIPFPDLQLILQFPKAVNGL